MLGGINPINFLNFIAKHFCEYFKKEASFAPLYPRAKFASKHTVGFLMRLLHLSLSQPQPQPTEPQPNVFIVFISLNKSTKRP